MFVWVTKKQQKEMEELMNCMEELLGLLREQSRSKEYILSEIKRLKEESWDKNAFYRLYKLLDELLVEEKN